MVVVGKHQPGVVDDHIAFAFERRHVLAYGVKTAKGDDLERCARILLRRREVASRRVSLAAAFARPASLSGELGALSFEAHVPIRLSPRVRLVLLRAQILPYGRAPVSFLHSIVPLLSAASMAREGPRNRAQWPQSDRTFRLKRFRCYSLQAYGDTAFLARTAARVLPYGCVSPSSSIGHAQKAPDRESGDCAMEPSHRAVFRLPCLPI